MRKIFASLALVLLLAGCTSVASKTVPTVKAQQTVDLAQSAYKANLRAELLYLNQKPCGLAGSPKAPFCASYAVGVKWKELDEKLKRAITNAQGVLNTVGSDPKVVDAAIAAIQLVLEELDAFTASTGVRT